MAKDPDHLAGSFQAENTGGFLTGFLAEEHAFDHRARLRLGTWGISAVGAVSLALVASQSFTGSRRDPVTGADLARQAQQIQLIARESQNETRRLASAIDTLNGDRDRLYSRVTLLEQGVETTTSALARQNSAAASPQAAAAAATATPSPSPNPAPSRADAPVTSEAAKLVTGALARQNGPTPSPQAAASPATTDLASPTRAPAPAVSAVAVTPAKSATGAAMARQNAAATAATAEQPAVPPVPTSAMASPVAAMAMKTTEKPPGDTAASSGPAIVASAVPSPLPNPASSAAAMPLMASKSILAPPDLAAGKLIEPDKPASGIIAGPLPDIVGSVSTEPDSARTASASLAVKRTEFAVDVGGASSVSGLRAIWRGLLKTNTSLAALSPIIVVKEGSGGLGLQLRLVAGPLDDAAAAAKICASLTESQRSCEPTVFDGQRLALKSEDPLADAKASDAKASETKASETKTSETKASDKNSDARAAETKPIDPKNVAIRPTARRRNSFKRVGNEDPPKKQPESSTLSSLFGKR